MTQNPPLDPLYRPCAGVILQNTQGLVFVGQRHDNPNDHWQMPQGGIDKGETPVDAAWRELGEEIGTQNAKLLYEHPQWLTYDIPEDLIPKLWGGSYKGQKQRWFLFQFLGQDSEINIETIHPEFRSWKWAEFPTLPDLVVPFKRDLYQDLVTIFAPYIHASF